MFSSGSGGYLYKLFGAHTKLQLIQTISSGILGCLAVLGVMVAARRAKAANETAKAANKTAANQVKATENQIEATKAANITAANQVTATENQIEATKEAKEANIEKAFATAIAQLASESNSVRLGCIYSLYDIAKKDKGRRKSISTILCMHLREKTKESQYQQDYKNKPSSEIQYLLDILTKLDKEGNFIWGDIRKDFSGAYLIGANLDSSLLKEADLNNAQLQGARLEKAQLQGAYLWEAQLQGTRLENAQLQGANLRRTQLQRADLRRTQLQKAVLENAQLQGANLRRTQLQGAYLWRTQLQGATLGWVQLQGAYLGETQLQGANLVGAQLQGTYLRESQLQGAYLRGAQLQGAYLRGSQLQGAYLNYAQLQRAIAPEERMTFIARSVRGFEEWINNCKNKNSELKEVVFSGGIDAQKAQEIINSFQSLYEEEVIDKQRYEEMKEIIERHKGKGKNYEIIPDPPEYKNLKKEYGFKTGVLTEEAAGQIIAEYKQAMKGAGIENLLK